MTRCHRLVVGLILGGSARPGRCRLWQGNCASKLKTVRIAEAMLHEAGVLSVPDFIANAGGVICAVVEYHGGTETQALTIIGEKIAENTRLVLKAGTRSPCPSTDRRYRPRWRPPAGGSRVSTT